MTESDRVLGVSVDRWLSFIQTAGVSTVILGFLLWQGNKHLPPLVKGHLDYLERSATATEKAAVATEKMAKEMTVIKGTGEERKDLLKSISAQQYPDTEWKEHVDADHKRVETKVSDLHKKICEP